MNHIVNLQFQSVSLVNKPGYPNYNFCHQNCENYVKLINPQAEHVLGWIKKHYSDGRVEFLLHSCIRENEFLVDLTPWQMPKMRGEFAEDITITIDPNVSSKFSFISDYFGELPLIVSA